MGYTKRQYGDVEPLAPGMHFLRQALDCDNLGVTVVEADHGWHGKTHDHVDSGQEEVYLLLEGTARLEVGDDAVSLDPGDAVRVDPATTRRLHFPDGGRMVIAGAP
ncbi:MAG: cupin domain-containing protein [Halobacteriales archaeon]